MAFNSLSFLLFFPVAAVGYYVISPRYKNAWLLVLSYYFYMCWDAVYALLILFSTVSTYLCAQLISKADKQALKKTALTANILVNLGILFIFKYYDMFSALVADAFGLLGIGMVPAKLTLLLPVGISFYTFQALGYSIDVYRGTVEHEKSFLIYALFVSFFPQLVAGPIERSGNLLPQFHEPHPFQYANVAMGLRIMLLGFFKKVVIADNISIAVDRMYTYLDVFPGPVLLYGVVLFAVQIYCDFGGYSDIAIGAAKVMGFDLMRNFDHPYFSQSISEFWRRWHISLGAWFRDYVYIPLGGNQKGTVRTLANLMIVFFLSGLWHGAAWTYVAWGCLHGLYQVVGKLLRFLRKAVFGKPQTDLPKFFHRMVTFGLVCAGWVFFRSENFGQAAYIFTHLYRGWGIFANPAAALAAFVSLADSVELTVIIVVSILILWTTEAVEYHTGKRFEVLLGQRSLTLQWSVYYLLLFSIALFGAFGQSAFIYFQF